VTDPPGPVTLCPKRWRCHADDPGLARRFGCKRCKRGGQCEEIDRGLPRERRKNSLSGGRKGRRSHLLAHRGTAVHGVSSTRKEGESSTKLLKQEVVVDLV
jgi:hypothetical protein